MTLKQRYHDEEEIKSSSWEKNAKSPQSPFSLSVSHSLIKNY
jgi:hypothetical protein